MIKKHRQTQIKCLKLKNQLHVKNEEFKDLQIFYFQKFKKNK